MHIGGKCLGAPDASLQILALEQDADLQPRHTLGAELSQAIRKALCR